MPPAGARKDPNGSPPLPPVPPRATVGSKTAGAEGCSDDLDELLFGGGFFVDTLDLNESTAAALDGVRAAGPSRGSAVLPSLHAQAKAPPTPPPDLLAPTAPPSAGKAEGAPAPPPQGGVGDGIGRATDFLAGSFDEEAEAKAFREAVMAWRGAGKASSGGMQ